MIVIVILLLEDLISIYFVFHSELEGRDMSCQVYFGEEGRKGGVWTLSFPHSFAE